MQLKRLYDQTVPRDDWKKRTEPCGACGGKGVVVNADATGLDPCPAGCERGLLTRGVPPVKGVQILHAGARQKFSVRLIATAVAEGWMTLDANRIIVKGQPQNVTYRIERAPGRYCCHCSEKLPDDVGGLLARIHVSQRHPTVPSPHPNHPAGYGMTNAFECVREG